MAVANQYSQGYGAHAPYQPSPEAHQSTPPERHQSFRMMTHVLGALLSLILIIGAVIWVFNLVSRDVSGVPVIAAHDDPFRVRPADPGGETARHQGLAVNAVAAEGVAAAPADEVTLAPKPVDLAVAEAMQTDDSPQKPVAATAASQDDASLPTDSAGINALVEQMTAGIEPLEELAPVKHNVTTAQTSIEFSTPEDQVTRVVATDQSSEEATVALIEKPLEKPLDGLAVSLRPQTRPARNLAAQQAVARNDAIPNVSVPVGTRLAQLGAYGSAEIAGDEWTRLSGKFSSYMAGKDPVIQKATSGGRVFYRLRVMGFSDLGDARRFCSVLVAENQDCIPVVTR